MLFDQRTRAKLREAGLENDTLRSIEKEVAAEAEEEAERVEAFFADLDVVYSDMDLTHSRSEYPEHDLEFVDLFTHSQDIRGYIRFETWGAYVEGARTLSEDGSESPRDSNTANGGTVSVVELELGPTVHDRVRFARDRAALE